jgi:hypothetical protein
MKSGVGRGREDSGLERARPFDDGERLFGFFLMLEMGMGEEREMDIYCV